MILRNSATALAAVILAVVVLAPDLKAQDELALANNRFGLKLLSELNKAEPANIFISPASISMALTMTWNGANDSTREAMAKSLEITGLDPDVVNHDYAQLREDLQKADPQVKLTIANSLWARKGIAFREEFVRTNQECFAAEMTALDFARPDATKRINDWVKKSTGGMIDRIVEQINPLDILFLINAIYFKGKWTDRFKTEDTRDRDFTLDDGTTKKVPMMHQDGKYRYFRGEGFQAVSLPYGAKRMSMYVFLPDRTQAEEFPVPPGPASDSGKGTQMFLDKLTSENWETWMGQFRDFKGDVTLPKFRLEYEASLNVALKTLGMGIAFDPAEADFTRMVKTKAGAHISEVKHKAVVEVNEEGTEAAAVTSVRMALTAMPPPEERFSMIVDHPFFLAIRDNQTGMLLFTGIVRDPKSK
jgi:serpin B